MYGKEIFSDYKKLVELDKVTNDLFIKYKIEWTLLPADHILNRYLKDCKGWKSLYLDDSAEILKRKT
jgi:hypothetical protein